MNPLCLALGDIIFVVGHIRLSAGSVQSVVPGIAILDDANPPDCLTSMEFAVLGDVDLDIAEPLDWLIPLRSMGLVVVFPAASFLECLSLCFLSHLCILDVLLV